MQRNKVDANKIAKQVFIEAGIKYVLDRQSEGKITWQKQIQDYIYDLITKSKILDKDSNPIKFDRIIMHGLVHTIIYRVNDCVEKSKCIPKQEDYILLNN